MAERRSEALNVQHVGSNGRWAGPLVGQSLVLVELVNQDEAAENRMSRLNCRCSRCQRGEACSGGQVWVNCRYLQSQGHCCRCWPCGGLACEACSPADLHIGTLPPMPCNCPSLAWVNQDQEGAACLHGVHGRPGRRAALPWKLGALALLVLLPSSLQPPQPLRPPWLPPLVAQEQPVELGLVQDEVVVGLLKWHHLGKCNSLAVWES